MIGTIQQDSDLSSKEFHRPVEPEAAGEQTKLVRVIKSIVVNPDMGNYVDDTIIKFQYYNSFNYSLLSRDQEKVGMTLGITSPNAGTPMLEAPRVAEHLATARNVAKENPAAVANIVRGWVKAEE